METLASAKDAAEIRARMESVTEADERLWGVMRVGEMVCHVRESYLVGLGERGAESVTMALPAPVMKWLALWTPMRWPHGVPTLPELRVGSAGLVTGAFADEKAGMMREMERFAAVRENVTHHPIFGSMRPRDWMRWGYLHADHHLRQFGR